jgi:hypothetical protein
LRDAAFQHRVPIFSLKVHWSRVLGRRIYFPCQRAPASVLDACIFQKGVQGCRLNRPSQVLCVLLPVVKPMTFRHAKLSNGSSTRPTSSRRLDRSNLEVCAQLRSPRRILASCIHPWALTAATVATDTPTSARRCQVLRALRFLAAILRSSPQLE